MFSYELKKITTWRIISIFLIFTIICLYYVISGISEYNGFLNDKNNFLKYENLKFQAYKNYEQYGGWGFHVLLVPNPLVIFFNNRQLLPTKCNIDTSEMIDIDNPRKGRPLFSGRGFFRGFAGFCTFFGILFYFYLGLTGFKSIKHIQFYNKRKFLWRAVGIRLLVLNVTFLLLFSIAFCIPLLFGIKFSAHELKIYSLFVLYTLAVLSPFYLSGAAISIYQVKNNKKLLKMTMVLLLIIFILIPEILSIVISGKSKQIQSVDKINITKFNNLADFEKKSRKIILEKVKEKNADPLKIKREHMARYLNGPYQENEELENQIFLETKGVISFEEILSILIPPVFHSYFRDEAPGTGYYGYVGFFDYIMALRFDFMKFYIEKRQFKQVEQVESFVKAGENVYKSKAFLPVRYYWALGITLLYSIVLIFISDRKLCVWLDEGGKQFIEGTFEFNKIEVGHVYYVFFGSELVRDKWYGALRGWGTIYIDRVDPGDFDLDVTLGSFLKFAAFIESTDLEKTYHYMDILELDRDILVKKIEDIDFEVFKKFYCALKFAQEEPHIILNDYAKGSSKELNKRLRELLDTINEEENKTIVYLGSEMYDTVGVQNQEQQISEYSQYKIFKIEDINQIVL